MARTQNHHIGTIFDVMRSPGDSRQCRRFHTARGKCWYREHERDGRNGAFILLYMVTTREKLGTKFFLENNKFLVVSFSNISRIKTICMTFSASYSVCDALGRGTDLSGEFAELASPNTIFGTCCGLRCSVKTAASSPFQMEHTTLAVPGNSNSSIPVLNGSGTGE